MKKLLLITAILALGAFAVQAQTTFIATGADISVTNSWDNGMPNLGNQGTIAIDAIRTNDVDIAGWDIVVASGGTLTDTVGSFGVGEIHSGSILEIQTGGIYTRTSGTMRVSGGAAIKVTGGTVDLVSLVPYSTGGGGLTLEVSNGGSFTAAQSFNFNSNDDSIKSISVSSGSLSIAADGIDTVRALDEANIFYNVSGGVMTLNDLTYATGNATATADDTNIVATVSGTGQLVTHNFNRNNNATSKADRYVNFATDDVSALWTWTGKVEADFIALWDQGTLRHNGQSGLTGATFAEHFLVTDDSISPVAPPEATDFTNGSSDGTWANPLNWSKGVPSSSILAQINGGLTANLSGDPGDAQGINVGSVAGESGTVENGFLTVAAATGIGTAPNASGVVNLSLYMAGSSGKGTSIGSGDGASGSLVAGTGSLTGGFLSVGTGVGASGSLDLGTGTLSYDDVGSIATGSRSTGTVTAASADFFGNQDLSIANGINSVGSLTADSGLLDVAILRIGTSSNAVGTVDIGTGTVTSSADIRMGTGRDSKASLTAASLELTGGADLQVATGQDSAITLVSPTVTVRDGGDLLIATGLDSTATLTVASPIVLNSTNGVFIGTGMGSSHNLAAANLSISGPIGNFGVGQGTGSSIVNLFSLHETIGSITANTPLDITAGSHTVTGITIADAADSTGSLTFSGSATKTISGNIDIASGANTSVALDLADLVVGDHTAGAINVGRGGNAVGSLTYTDANLIITGTMEVGTGGDGSDATVLLKNLTGGEIMSVCNSGIDATGTVTVFENCSNGTVRVARGIGSVGTLTVGGTLTAGQYLNSAGNGSNAVGRITATTLNKTINGSVQIAQGNNTDGSIIASDGTLVGNLAVAAGNGSLGLFAVTNGTMSTMSSLQIATGHDSDGTVLVGVSSIATNNSVTIGTGSNSIGRLTLPAGTLLVNNLTLGNSAVGGNGTITLAGGNMVVAGTIGGGAGATSFIDVTAGASQFTWVGRVEADFIGLWNTGMLRRNGESNLTSATFSDYFTVAGDVLSAASVLPIGKIVFAGPIAGGGMILSWDSVDGQAYNVEINGNLVYGSWTTHTPGIIGTGGELSVTTAVDQAASFYRVISN